MDQYFDRMKILAENQDFPIRIRFMLKDVIELRRDGWVPRKATSTEGPMPINQVWIVLVKLIIFVLKILIFMEFFYFL